MPIDRRRRNRASDGSLDWSKSWRRLCSIFVVYPGAPPFGAALVRTKPIKVLPGQWAALPAGTWPPGFAALPVNANGSIYVTRTDVFQVAAISVATPNALNYERLMLAAAAWGAGTRSRSVKRAMRPWTGAGPAAPTPGTALAAAAAALAAGGAVAAYASLLSSGANYVKYLGPAFFTKFLYFVGYGQIHPGPDPLILDSYVARGLTRLIGIGGANPWVLSLANAGWSTSQYGAYLAWAAGEAALGVV